MFNLLPRDIEYNYFNERDIEIPILLGTIENLSPRSLLDVGAFYSYNHYAPLLRSIMTNKLYDAVDILEDPITECLVDHYIQGNVCDLQLNPYDSIVCISAIEHAGLNPYQAESYRMEQNSVFARLVFLAKSHLLLSFPFGIEDLYPNQYANIINDQLYSWEDYARGEGAKETNTQFWFNEFPQGREKWDLISREDASIKPLRPERGAQCIGFLEVIL